MRTFKVIDEVLVSRNDTLVFKLDFPLDEDVSYVVA